MANTINGQASYQNAGKDGGAESAVPNQAQDYAPWQQYPPYHPHQWAPYYPPYPQQNPSEVKQEYPPPPQDPYQPPPQVPYQYAPYPYYNHYQSQGYYPPGPYAFNSMPPNPAWGQPVHNYYGDWGQHGQNVESVDKMEPVVKIERTENSEHIPNVESNEVPKDLENAEQIEYSDKLVENVTSAKRIENGSFNNMKNSDDTMEFDKTSTSDLGSSVDNSLEHKEETEPFKNVIPDLSIQKEILDFEMEVNDSNLLSNESIEYDQSTELNETDINEEDLNNIVENAPIISEEQKDVKPDQSSLEINETKMNKTEYSEWFFDDPVLPVGWISRSYSVIANGKIITEYQFLSPEQTLFSSLSSLINYMKSKSTFSQEFMENLIVNKSGNVETEQILMNSLSKDSNKSSKDSVEQKGKKDRVNSINYSEWVEDDSLPTGWKKRSYEHKDSHTKAGKVTKFQYLSTTKEIFTARSSVVDYLKKSGMYSTEEIEKVLSGKRSGALKNKANSEHSGSKTYKMEKQAWEDDETLPEGWKRRAHISKSSGHLQSYSYQCPNTQKIFRSRKDVITYMQDSDIYPMEIIQDTIEKGKLVRKSRLENPDDKKYSWKDDETLPEGWKRSSHISKSTGKVKKYSYLCPNKEKIFGSRNEVITYMQNSNMYTPETINDSIEKGTFENQNYIKKDKLVKKDDSKMNILERYNWEDDESLPEGWKRRAQIKNKENKVKQYFYICLSNQKVFSSRKEVITYMQNSNMYTQAAIEKVISGGRKRSTDFSNKTPRPSKHIKLSEILNEEDKNTSNSEQNSKATKLEMLNLLLAKPSLQVEILQFSQPEPTKTVEQDPSTVEIPLPQISTSKLNWEVDDSLPKGWRKQSSVHKRKTSKGEIKTGTQYKYLSPTQQTFTSRTQIVAHMRESQNYSEEEIMAVQNGKKPTSIQVKSKVLEPENINAKTSEKGKEVEETKIKAQLNSSKVSNYTEWSEDDSLPTGWKRRSYEHKDSHTKTGKVTKYQYVSTTKKIFSTRSSVVEFMKKSGSYSTEEIKKVSSGSRTGKHLIKENSENKIQETKIKAKLNSSKVSHYTEWSDDDTLPSGWKKRSCEKKCSKSKTGKMTKYQYLSNTKKMFSSRTSVVEFMKESGTYSPQELKKVSSYSRKGKGLINFKDNPVNKIEAKAGHNLENKENEVKLDKSKNKSAKFICSSWESDGKMLPEGWMKRSFINSKDVKVYQYLGLNDQSFQSTKDVFKFMRQSNKYSLDDALKFLSGVKKQENSDDNKVVLEEDLKYEFECNYCPQEFGTSNDKLNHQQQEHAGEFRYKCNDCGAGNLKKMSLFYHVQSKHSDVVRADQVTFEIEVPHKPQISNQTRKSASQPRRRGNGIAKKFDFKSPKNHVAVEQAQTMEQNNTQNKEEQIYDEPAADVDSKGFSEENCDLNKGDIDDDDSNHINSKVANIERKGEDSELNELEDPENFENEHKNNLFNEETDNSEGDVVNTDSETEGENFDEVNTNVETKEEEIETEEYGDTETEEDKLYKANIDAETEQEEYDQVDTEEEEIDVNNETEEDEENTNMKVDAQLERDSNDGETVSEIDEQISQDGVESVDPDEEDIEIIETITQQDWIPDPTLPEGWKRRPLIGHSNERKRDGSMVVTKYQYLSPDELLFDSRKEILDYMDIYTHIPNAEQIQQLSMDYEKETEDEISEEMDNYDAQVHSLEEDEEKQFSPEQMQKLSMDYEKEIDFENEDKINREMDNYGPEEDEEQFSPEHIQKLSMDYEKGTDFENEDEISEEMDNYDTQIHSLEEDEEQLSQEQIQKLSMDYEKEMDFENEDKINEEMDNYGPEEDEEQMQKLSMDYEKEMNHENDDQISEEVDNYDAQIHSLEGDEEQQFSPEQIQKLSMDYEKEMDPENDDEISEEIDDYDAQIYSQEDDEEQFSPEQIQKLSMDYEKEINPENDYQIDKEIDD